MDLLPASQTFKTLKEAKDAVPGIVRERKTFADYYRRFQFNFKGCNSK